MLSRRSVLADEERRWQGAENPVPHGAVGAEAFDGACRERNDATPCVLGVPDMQDGRVEIDVSIIECDRFADPQPGDRQQPEQGRIGRAPQSPGRRQPCGFGHDAGDLVVGVNVRPLAPLPVRDQSSGWDLRPRIDPLKPGREATHDGQPDRPGVRAGRAEPALPAQEQIGRDPVISLGVGKADEGAQDEAAGR